MDSPLPSEVGGYILAGGKSTRMGRDKALLELAGKPLIRHAVKKLRRICMDVRILSTDERLGAYAPLVPDLHPGCGPLGGLEAAITHSIFDWNLLMAVDMPFLPSAFVDDWVRRTLMAERRGSRVSLFTVDGIPQPALCLVHRAALPWVTAAIEKGKYKLYPVLEQAGKEMARALGVLEGHAFRNLPWVAEATFSSTRSSREELWVATTEAQQAAKYLWFANLNTPEEFADAERSVDALDT